MPFNKTLQDWVDFVGESKTQLPGAFEIEQTELILEDQDDEGGIIFTGCAGGLVINQVTDRSADSIAITAEHVPQLARFLYDYFQRFDPERLSASGQPEE